MSEHKWVGQQVGGSPVNAESYEWVRYCEICGLEDTCEDPLPSCDSFKDMVEMLNSPIKVKVAGKKVG